MAKKKGSPNGRRDDTITTLETSLTPTLPFRISQLGDVVEPNPQYLQTDRRRHNPTRSISPPDPNRNAARIVVKTENLWRNYKRAHLLFGSPTKYARRRVGYSTISERLSFNVPKRLEMCLRRKIRKEVLHAKNKAGKKGQKRPIRNFWSKISC